MRKINFCHAVLLLPLLIYSELMTAAPAGETIAREGNDNGAPACQTCHGDRGQGLPDLGYPYLAGQPAHYLAKQLKDFSDQRRSSPLMQDIASALSVEEINALAGYYSSLPMVLIASSPDNQAQSAIGETLAKEGKWSVGMPACFQCHGDKGQGIAPHFPAISGQSSAYLKTQLEDWQKGKRSNDHIGLMQAVVIHLDDTEISALADYLAAQSPAGSSATGEK